MTEPAVSIKNALHQASPWVWLADVELDDDDALRVCDSDETITYGGSTFYPFPMVVEGYAADGTGNLPSVTVTVSALSREISDAVDEGGLVDRSVQLWVMSRSSLTTAYDRGRWLVLDVAMSDSTASFRLGPYGLFDAPYPARRQARSRCDYVYAGRECLYDTTLPNLIAGTRPNFDRTTCDLSIDGGNGCRAHGENEVANGRPRLHPARIGCAPGIPKGPGRL